MILLAATQSEIDVLASGVTSWPGPVCGARQGPNESASILPPVSTTCRPGTGSIGTRRSQHGRRQFACRYGYHPRSYISQFDTDWTAASGHNNASHQRPRWALHCRSAFDGIWPKPERLLSGCQCSKAKNGRCGRFGSRRPIRPKEVRPSPSCWAPIPGRAPAEDTAGIVWSGPCRSAAYGITSPKGRPSASRSRQSPISVSALAA